MTTRCALSIAALIIATPSAVSLAAPPKLDHLFPAGASPSTSRTISASGTFSNWPPHVWIDREGVTFVPSDEKGKLDVSVSSEAVGVYYLRLFDADGASSVRPFVVDSLPSIDEVEPNNAIKESQAIQGNGVIDGVLHKSGEVDRFVVPLKKGQTLVASLIGNTTLGSPMDAVMQITDSKGFVVAQNDDSVGTDPRIAFEVPHDGEYVVSLFAFPSTPNSTINFAGAASYIYRLTLTTAGFVDHCFPLAFNNATDQSFQMYGWNLNQNTTVPNQFVTSGERTFVARPDVASFVEIRNDILPVLQSEIQDESSPISWPVVVSGNISSPGEVDNIIIEAQTGQTVHCHVESDALGYLLDPVITIYDDKGTKLSEVDDVGKERDGRLSQKIAADGRYRIAVRDLYGAGGLRYAYRMTIGNSPPGFDLSISADSFVVKSGEKLSIPVAVARHQGCNAEIEISVAGLPDKMTANMAKSESKGDSSKSVTLELTGTPADFSGPITIHGHTIDESRIESFATFNIADTAQSLSQIWLTVTK